MFKDKVVLAGLAGFIGIIGDQLIEWPAFLLKITNSTTVHMISSIIYSSPQLNSAQLFTGEIAHLIARFVLGIIPLILYLWSGRKYSIIKGAGIGAGFWLNHVVLIC